MGKLIEHFNLYIKFSWTPLFYACSLGEVKSVEKLIELNASLHQSSNKGYSPLHIAAIYN